MTNASFSSTAQKSPPNNIGVASIRPISSKSKLHLVATQGQIQIHTATYRGSFSVVLSEALRSAGLGSRVMVAQFLRGGVNQGPSKPLHLCGKLEWIRPSIEKCIPVNDDLTQFSVTDINDQKAIKEVWEVCKERFIEPTVNKIVLDEIGLAISLGYIKEHDLINTLNNRPSSTDVILTGPLIPPQIMEMADQITELRCS